MTEYIEREKYVKLNDIIETLEHEWGYEGMREDLYNLPTADVVEVKHGEWHLLYNCANEGVYCSVCNKKVYKTDYANQKIKSPYCPNCGTKMDKKEGADND